MLSITDYRSWPFVRKCGLSTKICLNFLLWKTKGNFWNMSTKQTATISVSLDSSYCLVSKKILHRNPPKPPDSWLEREWEVIGKLRGFLAIKLTYLHCRWWEESNDTENTAIRLVDVLQKITKSNVRLRHYYWKWLQRQMKIWIWLWYCE